MANMFESIPDISSIPATYLQEATKLYPVDAGMSVEQQREQGIRAIEYAYELWRKSQGAKEVMEPTSSGTSERLFTASVVGGKAPVTVETPPEAPVDAPKIPVLLQLDGHPIQHQVWYHRVVCTPTCLVLIYDMRAVGYPRFRFPEQAEGDACLLVGDDSVIYRVQLSCFRFHLDNLEITVLPLLQTLET